MRHRRDVADRANLDARSGEGANSALTSRSGTGDANVDRTQTVIARGVRCVDRGLLRGKRSSLAGAAEAERARAFPDDRIALLISDSDDGVVKARLDINEPERNVLPFPLLELLTLTGLGAGSLLRCLCHGLLSRFLLAGNGALTGSLAGASVGVGALAADRKVATVAQATVGLNLDQALDVQADLLAEVALDLAFCFDDVTNLVELVFVQRGHLGVSINTRLLQNLQSAGLADAIDVRERDASLLVRWQVDAGNTCHGVPFGWGSSGWQTAVVIVERLTEIPEQSSGFSASSGFIARLDFGELARWGRMKRERSGFRNQRSKADPCSLIPYPCLCLCLAFSQITRTTPRR